MQLAKLSYNRAKQALAVFRPALGLAVEHEVMLRNPTEYVSRLRRPASTPNAIRTAIAYWAAGRSSTAVGR
ncbi:hypothetical protein ACU4IU_09550 [Brevibacterium sp. CSND-B09]|uniref:hypothetical protein n=1 Tax=Brevibacterium sp. CSND-B09 TaxID=3462571 RepID=UPI00406A917B